MTQTERIEAIRNGVTPWITGTKHPDSKKRRKDEMNERRRARQNKRLHQLTR